MIYIFDTIKFSVYLLYFGVYLCYDLRILCEVGIFAGTAAMYASICWYVTFLTLNMINYGFFVYLSFYVGYVNDILRANKYIDSYRLANMYHRAQMCDTFMVLFNMLMLINYTRVSRRVSLIFGLIQKTIWYLLFLVLTYIVSLLLMALIVWQVWGDRLSYFRNLPTAIIYTFALFDLKSMYVGKNFMEANQYGVDSLWLFSLIILFAVVLHYSITLQYSAYFHIYFKIALKYENLITDRYPEMRSNRMARDWLMGFCQNPCKKKD